jgi:hypothetical protein
VAAAVLIGLEHLLAAATRTLGAAIAAAATLLTPVRPIRGRRPRPRPRPSPLEQLHRGRAPPVPVCFGT